MGAFTIETDDLRVIGEQMYGEIDLHKVLEKAGITEETLDKAKNLRKARDFKRKVPKFEKKLKMFKEELDRFRETGKNVNEKGVKENLKKAELLEITLNGRAVKKRFLEDKLRSLREEESALAETAENLNLTFKKELEDIRIE
jgi:hypothetical protein